MPPSVPRQLNFLMSLFIENNSLQSKLHRKTTAGNSTLNASSFHPKHLVASIPYGAMLRLRRICSLDGDLSTCQCEAYMRFKARGYSDRTISRAIERANAIQRDQLLMGRNEVDQSEMEVTTVGLWTLVLSSPTVGKRETSDLSWIDNGASFRQTLS